MKKVDWDAANMPEDAKLAYNDVFAANDNIWAKIIEIMDGKFYLDSDGYDSEPLKPSDNGWEDSHLGNKNDVVNDSTQLTKAAKWTNAEKNKSGCGNTVFLCAQRADGLPLCFGYQYLHGGVD